MYKEDLNSLLLKLVGEVDNFLDDNDYALTIAQENQLYDEIELALDKVFDYPDYRNHL